MAAVKRGLVTGHKPYHIFGDASSRFATCTCTPWSFSNPWFERKLLDRAEVIQLQGYFRAISYLLLLRQLFLLPPSQLERYNFTKDKQVKASFTFGDLLPRDWANPVVWSLNVNDKRRDHWQLISPASEVELVQLFWEILESLVQLKH